MNIKLNNIKEASEPALDGYQPIKLVNIHHRKGCYHVLGPLPITPEVETALRLWLPTIDPEFIELNQFTYLGIQSGHAFRLFWEVLAIWKSRGGTAITFEDAVQAMNNAQQPGRPVVLRLGAEARYGAA